MKAATSRFLPADWRLLILFTRADKIIFSNSISNQRKREWYTFILTLKDQCTKYCCSMAHSISSPNPRKKRKLLYILFQLRLTPRYRLVEELKKLLTNTNWLPNNYREIGFKSSWFRAPLWSENLQRSKPPLRFSQRSRASREKLWFSNILQPQTSWQLQNFQEVKTQRSLLSQLFGYEFHRKSGDFRMGKFH